MDLYLFFLSVLLVTLAGNLIAEFFKPLIHDSSEVKKLQRALSVRPKIHIISPSKIRKIKNFLKDIPNE